MPSILWTCVVIMSAVGIAGIAKACLALKRNIDAAKMTGLPYFVAPVAFLETHWLLFEPAILGWLKRLPNRWTSTWLPLASLIEVWRAAYLPFLQAKADVFIIVTPSGLNLWSADADVNDQILSSTGRDRFPKAVELLGVMRSWGPALPASEGEEARLTRKAVSPCFNEDTHRRVWQYGIRRTGEMISEEWKIRKRSEPDHGVTSSIVKDCKSWTLSVICAVCYGKNLREEASQRVPVGFELSFADAVHQAFHYFFTIFLVPQMLLRVMPISLFKKAHVAYCEWYKHLSALRDDEKAKQLHSVDRVPSSSILGNLISSEASPDRPNSGALGKDVILGNISNFVVAGHETTANTLAFIVALMALNPDVQREVHKELLIIFGSDRISRPESWSFEEDFPLLQNGLLGAVQSETMRLFPLAPTSTRKTVSNQELRVNARRHLLPAGCRCFPSTVATHTNPKYWGPLTSHVDEKKALGLFEDTCASEDFMIAQKVYSWNPKRWLDSVGKSQLPGPFVARPVASMSETCGNIRPIKSIQPGTFLPFSRGTRSCIGMRFAQVEMCAFMARLFSECELRIAGLSTGSVVEERRRVVQNITIKAGTTMTYKPSDDLELVAIPRASQPPEHR